MDDDLGSAFIKWSILRKKLFDHYLEFSWMVVFTGDDGSAKGVLLIRISMQ
jgi:hypothetical protein